MITYCVIVFYNDKPLIRLFNEYHHTRCDFNPENIDELLIEKIEYSNTIIRERVIRFSSHFIKYDDKGTSMTNIISKLKENPNLLKGYSFKFSNGKHDDGYGHQIPPEFTVYDMNGTCISIQKMKA